MAMLTFKERTHHPHPARSQVGELTVGELEEHEWNAAEYHGNEVGY